MDAPSIIYQQILGLLKRYVKLMSHLNLCVDAIMLVVLCAM